MIVNYAEKNFNTSMVRSFRETGFAVILNHPIPLKLLEETYQGWRNFFEGSSKYDYQYNKKSLDGYFPFGEEKEAAYYRDLKEFYYFYPWGKCPVVLKEKTLLLYNALMKLGCCILNSVEQGLENEVKKDLSMSLTQMVNNSNRAVLRILHYPAINKDNFGERINEGAIRANEHEDLTLISIIMPMVGSGLEVKDLSGNWHKMEAGFDKLVINIGDMLELCTQGFYKATTHRVENPTGEEMETSRYSNAFFLNPRDEIKLKGDRTAFDYLQEHIKKKLEYEQV